MEDRGKVSLIRLPRASACVLLAGLPLFLTACSHVFVDESEYRTYYISKRLRIPDDINRRRMEDAGKEWIVAEYTVWRRARFARGGNQDILLIEMRNPKAGKRFRVPSEDCRARYDATQHESFLAEYEGCIGTIEVLRFGPKELELLIQLSLKGIVSEILDGRMVPTRKGERNVSGRHVFKRHEGTRH